MRSECAETKTLTTLASTTKAINGKSRGRRGRGVAAATPASPPASAPRGQTAAGQVETRASQAAQPMTGSRQATAAAAAAVVRSAEGVTVPLVMPVPAAASQHSAASLADGPAVLQPAAAPAALPQRAGDAKQQQLQATPATASADSPEAAKSAAKPKRRRRKLGANRALPGTPDPEEDFGALPRPPGLDAFGLPTARPGQVRRGTRQQHAPAECCVRYSQQYITD